MTDNNQIGSPVFIEMFTSGDTTLTMSLREQLSNLLSAGHFVFYLTLFLVRGPKEGDLLTSAEPQMISVTLVFLLVMVFLLVLVFLMELVFL